MQKAISSNKLISHKLNSKLYVLNREYLSLMSVQQQQKIIHNHNFVKDFDKQCLIKVFLKLYSNFNQMATYEEFIHEGSPQPQKQKKIGSYLIQKTLGKGTFGKVKLATHIPTGQKVAIKILEKDRIVDVADVERVSREIHILKLIRHPNIIQLYEIIQTPKHLFLVMQFMERGELFDYIVSKKRMEQEQACKVFEQIISGIEYIHKLRIVHRDLKLQNCLIDYDKTIRIVDFGLSNTYKPDERLRTACGSPCYAAPEMIDGKAPYEPIMVDVWSAGVILFAMVCGFLPFQDKDTPKLYRKILNGQYSISGHVSIQLQDFISKVLTVDPNKRIRIEDMKKHPWWKKYSDNYYPEGLIVGYHKIPIQTTVLKQIQSLGIDAQLTQKSLETNLHNNLTTTYYILLKKCLREGTLPKNHFHDLDKFAVESNQRRSKNNLKAADILKMISTPNEKHRSKSYYLGSQNFGKRKTGDDINSLGSHSVRIEQKRKSASKFKKDKNQSFERDRSYNNSKYFKPVSKSTKKDKSLNKSINKSSTKHPKSPKKGYEPQEENYMRSRANSQKNKIGGVKKSHQGSYMIGADSGADWPLEPKYKGDVGGKIRNAMRRR